MDDNPSVRGAISYIVNGVCRHVYSYFLQLKIRSYSSSKEADYLLAAVLPTVPRLKLLDFPASWVESPYYCMVPSPTRKLNTGALFQPLTVQV